MLVKRLGDPSDVGGEKWFLFRITEMDVKHANDLGIPFDVYFQYRVKKEISKTVKMDKLEHGKVNWYIFDLENSIYYDEDSNYRIDHHIHNLLNNILRDIAPNRDTMTGKKLLPRWLQEGGLFIRVYECERFGKSFTFGKPPKREILLKELDPKTKPNECKLPLVHNGL